jgi:hypothetical protein
MPTYYHVTEREFVDDIVGSGFLGGWGDWGYGVYLFGTIHSAHAYAQQGGWDGLLKDPVILKVETERGEAVQGEIHPEWPNPEDYEDVFYVRLREPDEGDTVWVPKSIEVLE